MNIKELKIIIMGEFSPALDLNNSISTIVVSI